MSNVIAFLQTMGQDAGLRHAGRAELNLALTGQEVEANACPLILRNDTSGLAALVGAKKTMCCILAPQRDNEEEEEPSRDDDEIRASSAIRVATTSA